MTLSFSKTVFHTQVILYFIVQYKFKSKHGLSQSNLVHSTETFKKPLHEKEKKRNDEDENRPAIKPLLFIFHKDQNSFTL
jgi:hypothetical protein